MFDTVFNLVILLIPLAIIIGRVVVSARNKHQPPARPAQPHIPVHFEDDDGYLMKRTPAKAPEAARPRTPTSTLLTTPTKLPTSVHEVFPPTIPGSAMPSTAAQGKQMAAAATVPPPERKEFTFNLNHLSGLKQAVVMAEILGPPKGME